MEVFGLLTLAALVIKVVSVIKAFGKDPNLVITQTSTWFVGIAVLFLAAYSDLGENIEVFGTRLGDFDALSIVLAGLALGSTGSFAYDYKKAHDNTDSAVEPSLTGPQHAKGCALPRDHEGVCRMKPKPPPPIVLEAEAVYVEQPEPELDVVTPPVAAVPVPTTGEQRAAVAAMLGEPLPTPGGKKARARDAKTGQYVKEQTDA